MKPAPENTMWDRDLLTAARGGFLNLAREALRNGANINCYDSNQHTPLINAIHNGQEELAALLIGRGADLTFKNVKGTSAYKSAVGMGLEAIAEVISDLSNISEWESVKPVMTPEPEDELFPDVVLEEQPEKEVKDTFREAIAFGPRLKVLQFSPDNQSFAEYPFCYSLRFDGKPLGMIQEISVLISVNSDHSHRRIIRSNYKIGDVPADSELGKLLQDFRQYCREQGIELLETNLGTEIVREPRIMPQEKE